MLYYVFTRSTHDAFRPLTLSLSLSPQVENLLLIVMQSAHLVAQRKAFQQSMDELLTLSREQTSSQPLIARALEQLKVPSTVFIHFDHLL